MMQEKSIIFSELFDEFIDGYFEEIDNIRDKKILYKRYGIKNKRKYTLEEIGKLNNISRQRVEQIEKKHINILLSLLKGKFVKNLNFEPNQKLKKLFHEIDEKINEKRIIGSNNFFQIINKYFSKNCSLNNGYILLILDLLNFDYDSCYDDLSNVFYDKEHINKKKLMTNMERIYKALKNEVIPMTNDDLIIEVIGRRKNYNLENIKLAISSIDEIEKVNINGIEMLQLNLLNKFSAGDLGYRLLFHNDSPMNNQQIYRKMNHLLKKNGYNEVKKRNIQNQLADHDKVKTIGQGKWALNEWDYEKKYIIDIMKDVFYEENKPLDKNELIKKVKEKRKKINKTSIKIYIDTNQKFINLTDGTIILKEWEKQYRNKIDKTTQIYHSEVDEIITDAYKYYDKKLLTKNQIWEYAKTIYHNKESSFKHLIANRDYLIREASENKIFWRLRNDYRKILVNSHGNKSNNIKKISIDILKSNYGNMQLKKIIDLLKNEYGYNKNTIRRVFDDQNDFKKTKNKDGHLILYLKENMYHNNINSIRISPSEFEDFMMQSKTEEAKFDFKQGFLDLSNRRKFDENSFKKIMKNICAMANLGKNKKGYLFIGITDDKSDSKRVAFLDEISIPEFNGFGIVGIEREALELNYNLEKYQNFIINQIEKSKLPKKLKTHIKSNLSFVHYKGKYILVFEIKCIKGPSFYGDDLYIRKGPNLHLVDKKDYEDVFRRCFEN